MQLSFIAGRLAAESVSLITIQDISLLKVCQILPIMQLRNLSLRAVEQQLKVTQLGSRRQEIQSWLGSRVSVLPSPLL